MWNRINPLGNTRGPVDKRHVLMLVAAVLTGLTVLPIDLVTVLQMREQQSVCAAIGIILFVPTVATYCSMALKRRTNIDLLEEEVRLEEDPLNINGRRPHLSPGIGPPVDTKAGTRKLVEYDLSPGVGMSDEAGREQ
jgi:hypothetical protein